MVNYPKCGHVLPQHVPDNLGLPSWMDQYKASRMVQLRALGYNQVDIARELGVSQQTVSKYLAAINEKAKAAPNASEFLWALLMIAAGAALFAALLKTMQGGGSR